MARPRKLDKLTQITGATDADGNPAKINVEPTKPAPTPQKPIKNFSGVMQAHGQVETFKPTTLAQILGDRGMYKYGTMDEKEYISSLASMNKSDLQSHAIKVGLVPVDDRDRLTKRLIYEFKLHVAAYRKPSSVKTAPKPVSPEVAKILAAGR